MITVFFGLDKPQGIILKNSVESNSLCDLFGFDEIDSYG
jgi:hypothetical protein